MAGTLRGVRLRPLTCLRPTRASEPGEPGAASEHGGGTSATQVTPAQVTPATGQSAAGLSTTGLSTTGLSTTGLSTTGRRPAVPVLGALFALTKPRIIELLLVTTLPVMLLAGRGVPALRLILVTMGGGALAAGCANTVNCVIDRDIDAVMRRTSRRALVAAVTGGVGWPAIVLFGVVFFWTPPHFWALAIKFRDDYEAAGVPTLPVVASPAVVARKIVAYSWGSALIGCAASWPAERRRRRCGFSTLHRVPDAALLRGRRGRAAEPRQAGRQR